MDAVKQWKRATTKALVALVANFAAETLFLQAAVNAFNEDMTATGAVLIGVAFAFGIAVVASVHLWPRRPSNVVPFGASGGRRRIAP